MNEDRAGRIGLVLIAALIFMLGWFVGRRQAPEYDALAKKQGGVSSTGNSERHAGNGADWRYSDHSAGRGST
jgi:hypothetical protein